MNLQMFLKGTPNWPNLIDWSCMMFTEGSATPRMLPEGILGNPIWCVPVAAHEIVDTTRQAGGSWEQCLKALQAVRYMAKRIDARWGEL